MKNLVLAALLTAAATTASAGPYAGVEYKSNNTSTEILGDDLDLTTSGFETYIGYDEKITDNTTVDVKLGYISGDIDLATDFGNDSISGNGYEVSIGTESKHDDITLYSRYSYNVMSHDGFDVPTHEIKIGIRYDF